MAFEASARSPTSLLSSQRSRSGGWKAFAAPSSRGKNCGCFAIHPRGGRSFKVITSTCLIFPVVVLAVLYLDLHHWNRGNRRHSTAITYLRQGAESLPPQTWACSTDQDRETDLTIGEIDLSGQILVYQKPSRGGIASSVKQFIMSLGSNVDLYDVIRLLWFSKKKQGSFKTSADNLQVRHSTGQSWSAELVYNPGRASKPINVPQDIPVDLAFDDGSSFSFLQAPANDLMFFFVPEDDAFFSSSNEGGTDVGARRISCRPGPGSGTKEASSLHGILINPYPVGPLSGVIAPFLYEKRSQKLTSDALRVALSFMSELRAGGTGGLRIGYNSLGAVASVNNMHFQFWSFGEEGSSPDGLLPIEHAPRRLISQEPIHTFVIDKDKDYPLKALAFAIHQPAAADPDMTAQVVAKCAQYLIDHQIPHSMLMNEEVLFLIPRQKMTSLLPFATLPGFPEVSGEVILLLEEDFDKITADEVAQAWKDLISVDTITFEQIYRNCTSTVL